MTVSEVLAEVERIRDLGERDYEAAHSAEDKLFLAVLRQIAADGNPLARAAIESAESNFERYCA